MSTWLDDITDPDERAAYALVGNQDSTSLRNMVTALSMFPFLNSEEANRKIAAAKLILRIRRQRRSTSKREQ